MTLFIFVLQILERLAWKVPKTPPHAKFMQVSLGSHQRLMKVAFCDWQTAKERKLFLKQKIHHRCLTGSWVDFESSSQKPILNNAERRNIYNYKFSNIFILLNVNCSKKILNSVNVALKLQLSGECFCSDCVTELKTNKLRLYLYIMITENKLQKQFNRGVPRSSS